MTRLILALVLLFRNGGAVAESLQRFPENYPVTSKRIKFPRGRTTAVIRGVARTPGIYEYVLKARAGQNMTAHLISSNNGVEFTIFAPDGSNPDGALGTDDWSGSLDASGDYKIALINNRSRRSRNPTFTWRSTYASSYHGTAYYYFMPLDSHFDRGFGVIGGAYMEAADELAKIEANEKRLHAHLPINYLPPVEFEASLSPPTLS